MDVSYREVRELNFNLIHDASNDYDEITPFISSLGKIKKEITRAGFRSMFSKDEKEVWKRILEKIVIQEGDSKGPEVKIL